MWFWDLGFGVWGLGFGVWGLGVGGWGLRFQVSGSGLCGFGVWGMGMKFLEFQVSGPECRPLSSKQGTTSQPRPDSGLGLSHFQYKSLNTFQVVHPLTQQRISYANIYDYKLGFNQNYYTFTLMLLIKFVMCSKFH